MCVIVEFDKCNLLFSGKNLQIIVHNFYIQIDQIWTFFDPNKHNALFEYPEPEKKAGTVGQIIKTGFLLNDRVLRSAEVGVVKN